MPSSSVLLYPVLLLLTFLLASCQHREVDSVATPAATSSVAPNPEVEGIVRREVVRRQALAKAAEDLLVNGDRLMQAGDAEGARAAYSQALRQMPR